MDTWPADSRVFFLPPLREKPWERGWCDLGLKITILDSWPQLFKGWITLSSRYPVESANKTNHAIYWIVNSPTVPDFAGGRIRIMGSVSIFRFVPDHPPGYRGCLRFMIFISRERSAEPFQLTIGSCFSVHYRVMEHAGSLESTKEA